MSYHEKYRQLKQYKVDSPVDRAMICNPKALSTTAHQADLLYLIGFYKNNSTHCQLSLQRKGNFVISPHNETIIITNQQGLLKMATSQEMKKLSVLKRVLILQQEVNLKVAVRLFQVWKNIIRFLLLMTPGMSEGWGERSLFGH